jgi:hypothetical protein
VQYQANLGIVQLNPPALLEEEINLLPSPFIGWANCQTDDRLPPVNHFSNFDRGTFES